MSDKKVVVLGGGTGLSILLRGLKQLTGDITAIVSVADDGGGSGVLREDLGMLPPGDIRSCMLALSNTEPVLEALFKYRFTEGRLKGQNFGNLMIAAMLGISESFEEALKKTSDILAISGKVLPVSMEDIHLCAELKDGTLVKGESNIPFQVIKKNSPIKRVYIEPENAQPLEEAMESIREADIIIIGPGSLYTSIIPNLLIKDMVTAVREANCRKVYIANMVTQYGETDGYSLIDHVEALEAYLGKGVLTEIYASNGEIPVEILNKYKSEKSVPVTCSEPDVKLLEEKGVKVCCGDFVEVKKGYLRHNALELAKTVLNA